jgi:pimeloyl-ACP methyl ester carboxylesterase
MENYIADVNKVSGQLTKLIFNPANNFSTTAQISNILNSNSIQKFDYQTYDKPTTPNLYKLKLPTLLLWGKYDFVCPPGLITDIKNNISSTDVSEKIFNNSGHGPMFVEEELFWNTLVDWVKVH